MIHQHGAFAIFASGRITIVMDNASMSTALIVGIWAAGDGYGALWPVPGRKHVGQSRSQIRIMSGYGTGIPAKGYDIYLL
jgi:hypothetical protein